MMNNYKIAELFLQMNPQFSPLTSRSKPYLSSDLTQEDYILSISEETYEHYLKLYPSIERGAIEYMVLGSQFYSHLICHSGLMLHASAVAFDGKAYLFSAPSGTGKSTHTSLWLKEFPNATIINDDKPAIRILPDGIFVYGTPWSGKSDLNINTKVPLQGIAFISRGESNQIKPADSKFAVTKLLEQTVRPNDPKRFSLLLDLIDTLVKHIPIYKLSCNMQPDAAHTAYEFMSKGVVK